MVLFGGSVVCRTMPRTSPWLISQSELRANPKINFRNGGSAEGSLARRGGKPIPIGLGLPAQHSQRPLAAPALSQAVLSEVLGRRPGRNGLSAASEAQGQGLRTLAFASFWQTGHFASAIWKFLSGFALSVKLAMIVLPSNRLLAANSWIQRTLKSRCHSPTSLEEVRGRCRKRAR